MYLAFIYFYTNKKKTENIFIMFLLFNKSMDFFFPP